MRLHRVVEFVADLKVAREELVGGKRRGEGTAEGLRLILVVRYVDAALGVEGEAILVEQGEAFVRGGEFVGLHVCADREARPAEPVHTDARGEVENSHGLGLVGIGVGVADGCGKAEG